MDTSQTKPRRAMGSVALSSILTIATVYLSDMGYLPDLLTGLLIGTLLTILTSALYRAAQDN